MQVWVQGVNMNPEDVVHWYDSLTYKHQRELMAMLSKVSKHPPAVLMLAVENLDVIAKCLKYCHNNKIKYDAANKRGKISMTFDSIETRNKVWFGMLAL